MIIVRVDTDTATAGVNMSMIRTRNGILASVCRMHHERQKRLSSKSLANILHHDPNLPKTSCRRNTCRPRHIDRDVRQTQRMRAEFNPRLRR